MSISPGTRMGSYEILALLIQRGEEARLPFEPRLRIAFSTYVLGHPGPSIGDQIRSIDKSRLRSRIGVLSREELLDVETALQITLGLPAV